MNILEKCVTSFEQLLEVKYVFLIARKKNITKMVIDFRKSDFKHLIGLQYLRDIALSRNSEKVYEFIKNKKLTYEKVEKSDFFEQVGDSYANVKERMIYFPMLKDFIESDNIILRYVRKKNIYSKIDADYVIESTVRGATAYIFFRKRDKDEEESTYAIVSFFLKNKVEYKGELRYWLRKERIVNGNTEVIYQKTGYRYNELH